MCSKMEASDAKITKDRYNLFIYSIQFVKYVTGTQGCLDISTK